jgi:tetratricopeptide (TPR) repeat protein
VGGAEAKVYFHLGLLHVEAGRVNAAVADWRRCMELSPSYVPSVLKVASTYADLQDADQLDALIPDCPETLLRVARDHLAGEELTGSRHRLLQRAQQLLTQMDIDPAERCYLTGCVRAAENKSLLAIQYVAQAVELRPEETAWRYELATLMHRRGMDDDAREQAGVCVQLEPENKQYESLLRQLIRTQLTDSTSKAAGAPDR